MGLKAQNHPDRWKLRVPKCRHCGHQVTTFEEIHFKSANERTDGNNKTSRMAHKTCLEGE